MEKMIRDVLIDYMKKNGFITKHQHGFRKVRSCATQLIEVMEQWTEYLDKKNSIDVIYLDFQKAFDTATQANMGVQSGQLQTKRRQ